MTDPDREKDRPAVPSSDSLIIHAIDEMPLRVVLACTFVAFFFVWGGVNNLIKLFGHDLTSLEINYGLISGTLASIATPIIIWRVKRRRR
ncbi:MAG: hypothetical protein ABW223_04395 [Rariglobus sp.]